MVKACYIGLVLVLLSGAWEGYGQGLEKVDSLKRVLDGRQGKDKLDVLWELTKLYAGVDYTIALKYANEAYEICAQSPVDSLKLATLGRRKAMVLQRLGSAQEALKILDYVLPIARRSGSELEVSMCLSVTGLLHSDLGNYSQALLLDMECLPIRRKLGDQLDVSTTLNNIGYIYYKLHNYTTALYYFLDCLAIKKSQQISYENDILYVNIGLCYGYLGQYEEGLCYVNEGILTCGKECDSYSVMNSELALGILYTGLKRPDLAEAKFKRSYDVAVEKGDNRYKAENLVCLGRQANDEQHYGIANRYLNESIQCALLAGSKTMIVQSYNELVRAKRGLGDFESAVLNWDSSLPYKDSLLNERIHDAMIDIQISFEQEKNHIQLALRESTVQWQGSQNFWIALVGGLLIIAIELLIYDFTGRRRENEILEALVRDRTRALEEKVRSLERQDTERRVWDEKIERSVRDGKARLDALRDMVDNGDIKNLFPILNDGQEGK